MRGLIAIYRTLRDYARDEVDVWSYGITALLLALAVAYNYATAFELRVIAPRFLEPVQIGYYALYYGLPLCGAVVVQAVARRETAVLRQPGLWAALVFAVVAYGTYRNFHYYLWWIEAALPPEVQLFVFRCAANLVRAALGGLCVLLFWLAVEARSTRRGYGLTREGIALRPYFLILALIAPLILWASAQPEFLEVYPRYTPGGELARWRLAPWQGYALFEVCYGADFVFTELFFRGLLVLGLGRWLGPQAVLPMVAFYAFAHFEKPLAETLGSIAGGWALGVIAYRTRSILGGVVIHLGVAYMMELAAITQLALRDGAS